MRTQDVRGNMAGWYVSTLYCRWLANSTFLSGQNLAINPGSDCSTRWHCSPWIHHLMFSEREECSWGLTFEMLSVCLFFVMVYLCCPWLRVCHHHLQKSEAYLRDAKLIISFELLFVFCLFFVCLFVCFLISTRDNFLLGRMNAVSENCIRFDATKWWNGVCSLTDALKGHWRSHHGGTGCKRW